ncbi:hypothetical protein IFM89_014384 [Coptis chinensis]|uniref:MLO-like protein n=1 Tax=Coptis chinensis TaxID=261450 RepID=A0A835GZ98_9MAGN|nr:hypothetical protein IFM89_014384 [Coptis chinensis]
MGRSLEETPIWAFCFVCLVLVLFSILIEGALNLLTKFLLRRKRKSLNRALRKIKTELMILGFISLLLTIGEVPISKICVTHSVANTLLPCKHPVASTTYADDTSCEAKGMVSLLSKGAVKQLHIFIFMLAVFHVLYCVLTMCLGLAKNLHCSQRITAEWNSQTSCSGSRTVVHIQVCFVRQLSRTVTKADYFTLRNGFIMAHLTEGSNFDFQKFLARAYDKDFEQVVGISLWLWILSIVSIFFHAHGFYNYLWLPFIPLLLLVIVGTKLEVIMTKMCLESHRKTNIVQGAMLVEPNDDLFWFSRPQLLLDVIHFILFQMGSSMKATVFTEQVVKGLKHWHNLARRNLSRTKSDLTNNSSEHGPTDNAQTSLSDVDLSHSEFDHFSSPSDMGSPALESTKEAAHQKIISRDTYDGEISFATSWKELENRKQNEEITSALRGKSSTDTN